MIDIPVFECVLDANVAIKLYINQPWSDKAIALIDLLQADKLAKIYVPLLFYAECANVLWQYVRLASYTASEAHIRPTIAHIRLIDATQLAMPLDTGDILVYTGVKGQER
ncbi:MAG: type II toxin-antitoxin system VapC family toxin [Hormoscilla sp. GUM202]|nr:type II toxin-antitoxin system VapC family toxin [Hormoscilla sp. GUM202]